MKIFSKQRMALIKSQRFKRYLIYGIGEIILVTIGILIALGINNWNQKLQLKNANTELQNNVLAQLNRDILFIENHQKSLDTLQEIYLKVLGRDYDKAKVDNNAVISTVLFEVYTLAMDKHINNLIDNAVLDKSKASQELVELNSTYKLYSKDIDNIDEIIYTKITNNLAEIEKTQSWYIELITDFKCRNDCINYLLHNEDHKSRIASLRFLYVNGYGNIIDNFREDIVKAKKSLQESMDN